MPINASKEKTTFEVVLWHFSLNALDTICVGNRQKMGHLHFGTLIVMES